MQQTHQPAEVSEQHQQDDGQEITRTRGFFYPRWPLIATLIMCLFILVGLGLRLYYLHHYCPLGFLCYIDTWPGWLHFLILLGTFVIVWFVASLFVGYLEAADVSGGHAAKFLIYFFRSISEFEPVRWIIIGFGGLLFALQALFLLLGGFHFEPVSDALVIMVLCVTLCALFRRIPRPVPLLTEEERKLRSIAWTRSPWYILRSKWPMRYIWPNSSPGPGNPAGQS